jgi:hypothetical protein
VHNARDFYQLESLSKKDSVALYRANETSCAQYNRFLSRSNTPPDVTDKSKEHTVIGAACAY